MSAWIDHLRIAPIVLPLASAALMLLLDERRRRLKAAINLASTVALLCFSVALLGFAEGSQVGVYILGNWPAPFGIVLVVDRLSALMLTLVSTLALATLVFSLARWHRAGAYFHSLFQFLLLGLNGAFLTGDLFNLYVFFEVMLAASYGLVLHGSGIARVKAGLHYIAVNLTASFVFLIGAGLIYGVTGTLNMADLATKIPNIAPGDQALLEAGVATLGIAFLVKAGMWPLGFSLPTAYVAAAPPVAAMFVIMSKVGVYVVLRLWLMLFGDGASAVLAGDWVFYGGLATIAFGTIGVLASQDTARLAACSVLVSSGTLLAAISRGYASLTGSALFYLVISTLAVAAFFLVVELVERGREAGADVLAVTREAYGDEDAGDPDDDPDSGLVIPATMAILGTSFVLCASLIAGLPPLSGFVAKFALLKSALDPVESGAGAAVPGWGWLLLAMIIVSGLAALIAMTRAGMRAFWAPTEREVPRVRVIEAAPVVALLALCLLLTLQAEPAMRYMQATAQALHSPQDYVRGVLSAPRWKPGPELSP